MEKLYIKRLTDGISLIWAVRHPMKIIAKITIAVGAILSTTFIAYFCLSAKSYLEGQSLINESKVPSLYLFQFDAGRVVTIRDDNNMFVRSWGGSAHEILIENGMRILKFNEAAILKTNVDSIEPQEEYVKVKGYMGIYTQDTEFHVNASGEISSDNWSGG